MVGLPNLWLVLKIIFCSTVGTVGILLSFLAIPTSIFLLIRYMEKFNKNKKGEQL